MLTPTDKLNIVCFVIFMGVSVACIIIAKKMKLSIWKFQVGWILLMDVIGVLLLVSRLNHGQF